MQLRDDSIDQRHRLTLSVLVWASALTVAFSILFIWRSDIDIAISRPFRIGASFIGSEHLTIQSIRDLFRILFAASIALAIYGIARAHHAAGWWHMSRRSWIFILACLVVAPGLIANSFFKQNWGRPRPHQTTEFGGSKSFQPAWFKSNECARNCSFVSGEASAIFTPFFAFALAMPHYAAPLLVSGTVLGLASGFVRMSQGGHFLSDVIFAGLFAAITCGLLHILLVRMRLFTLPRRLR